MQIVPMRDLKDTVKIEKMCVESNAPVFITKNGYGKLVVMDIGVFEELVGLAFEMKAIHEGLKDVEDGKLVDGKDALEKIKAKYGL